MTLLRRRTTPEILLGLAVLADIVLLTVTQWRITYFQDTFAFLLDRQTWTPHSFLIPHNEHIVILPVLICKLLLAVFGMGSDTGEQIVMGLSEIAAVIVLFVYARRRIGAWTALIFALLLLFLGSSWPVLLWPFENVFTLPVAFGIGALLCLDREDRRGDIWACLLLVLSTISGSLGVCFILVGFIDFLLKDPRGTWRSRAYVWAVPLLIYLAWYAGWGHAAEHHLTLENILNSPLYVMEGFASSLDSVTGLTTAVVGAPAYNDWGRVLVIGAIGLVAFGQWRRPGFSRRFWVVSAGALSYWLLAGFNFVPGREASSTRYVYAGVVFILLMAIELLRNWPFSRRALWVFAAVAVCAIGPNLARMKEGSDWEKEQSVFTRSDLAALEIARGTVPPSFSLGSPEITGTASLAIVEAGKWFEAVDRWGTPADTPAQLEEEPAIGRHYADKVLSQALPITGETSPGTNVSAPSGGSCVKLPGGDNNEEVELGPGQTAIAVSAGPAAAIALRRFATEEFPVTVEGGEGGTTTTLHIPKDRASQPWYLHVESSQSAIVCTPTKG